MTAVAISALAYETPSGGEDARVLTAAGACATRTDEANHVVARRARRKMSYSNWLAVEAAMRCARRIPEEERRRTPIFFGFPTGVEMVVPFLRAVGALAGIERDSMHERLLGGNAGAIVDYLKYSVGNSPGHVAEHTGLRGQNACFTGFGADLRALRKASLLLRARVIRHAVVVAAEGLPDQGAAGEDPAAIGVALLLTRDTASSAPALVLDDGGDLERVPPRMGRFEACSCVANLAWVLERGPSSRSAVFDHYDRWGRRMIYGVDWRVDGCAA